MSRATEGFSAKTATVVDSGCCGANPQFIFVGRGGSLLDDRARGYRRSGKNGLRPDATRIADATWSKGDLQDLLGRDAKIKSRGLGRMDVLGRKHVRESLR